MSGFQKDQVQDIYYLSPMQEGMLFHTLMDREQSFYVEQMSTTIRGRFQTKWLEESINIIIDRHDVFRTVYVYEKLKRPVQVVLKQRSLKADEIDLRGLSIEDQETFIDDVKQMEKERGFDLSRDIPMRMVVIRTGEDVYNWVWTYHHILLDGWCLGIVIQELVQIYEALQQNIGCALPSPIPYKEYIKWLEKQDKEQSLQYWSDYLFGFVPQASFAAQRNSTAAEGYRPEELRFQLNEEEARAFTKVATEHGVTLSTALQAVWATVLSRYHRSNDVVFGTVVSGRPAELRGVETMVGLFINVVPTRAQLSDLMSFQTLITQLQQQVVQSEAHQYVPIYGIQSKIGQHELIDHLFVFENYPVQDVGEGPVGKQCEFSFADVNIFEKTNYHLNFIASPGKELYMRFGYNANVYDDAFITRLANQLMTLIRDVIRKSHAPLAELEVVSERERRMLLSDFAAETFEEPSAMTLVEWFEEQVDKAPQRIALAAGHETLTYQVLNERANQLARVLRASGVTRETIVAMIVNRSPAMIIGILATLKAGGAYLPIDPEYPSERIRYMLQDSGAHLLLTQREVADLAETAGFDGITLFIDDVRHYRGNTHNIEPTSRPEDLAYVIYTSGTTGNPKGILTTHANVIRVVKNANYLEIAADETVLSLSNFAFDGFTFDLFGSLLNGARLILTPKETILDVVRLTQLIEHEQVRVMFVTTALFNLLVDVGGEWMSGVRKILFGGERSSVKHVRKALNILGPGRMIHVYGPTETTVFATFYPVDSVPDESVSIPIGRPLTDTSTYILGPGNHLQPTGAVGELCIGGTGLARSYLNRPDLTEAKFIAHPFILGERLYRTGDLARFLPCGNIEFVGRIDDQVKVRGHRIELGEIEHALIGHRAIKQAVVQTITSETGELSLCAYVVGEGKEALSSDELHRFLALTLPSYMVPPVYVVLDSLPLTANGKVNRRLLPQAPTATIGSSDAIPPRNDVELNLSGMWGDALGLDQLGVYDNFFKIGGHSLKAMALCAEMLKVFNVDVPMGLFFESPTIAAIAAYIRQADGEGEKTILSHSLQVNQDDSVVTLFNSGASRNLFAFPPVLGYGVVFSELAKELPDYRVHAFDFIDADNRIKRYAMRIDCSQRTGGLTLIGYSAGCSLAFEVAQELESLGRTIDLLIMIDSYKKDGPSNLHGRSVDEDVATLLNANKDNVYLKNESIRKGFASRLKAYYTYYVELINTGRVQAPIHLIRSETTIPLPNELSTWQEATTKRYQIHQGYGLHDEMLQGPYAMVNAKTIMDILSKAESDTCVTEV